MGDGNHDAKADCNHDSDHCQRCAVAIQNPQLPERGQNAANEDNKTNEIHNRPFHNEPPDGIKSLRLQLIRTSICKLHLL